MGLPKMYRPPQTATDTDLEVEQQKRRFAKMIEAQLMDIMLSFRISPFSHKPCQ
jgi:hypothetical protein